MSGPVIRRGMSRTVIDNLLVKRNHSAKKWEARMNNIFWIIGVIVVIIAVLSFFGLR
jgi:hypothetical protein